MVIEDATVLQELERLGAQLHVSPLQAVESGSPRQGRSRKRGRGCG